MENQTPKDIFINKMMDTINDFERSTGVEVFQVELIRVKIQEHDQFTRTIVADLNLKLK